MPFVRGFLPSLHGFRFSNSWAAMPLFTVDIGDAQVPIGNASNGLCGGMVFLCADYFRARLPVPREQPGRNTTLYNALVRRLFDSFDLPTGPATYLGLMNPARSDHETDASRIGLAPRGRAWVMANESWPVIRLSIDRNRLCPMALIRVKSLDPFLMGGNHQVLAYGYELQGSNLAIAVYDPNHPMRDNVRITLDIGNPDQTIDVQQSTGEQLFCFFPTKYSFAAPPFVLDGSRSGSTEVAWVDDVLPPDAVTGTADDDWNWDSTAYLPRSGNRTHNSQGLAGHHGHWFETRRHGLRLGAEDSLFAYVRLDSQAPARELLLEWRDEEGNWEHRAYWGENLIDRGSPPFRVGDLPRHDRWVRLQVRAADIGLAGRRATGMGFHVHGVLAVWDRAGKLVPGIRQRRVRFVTYEVAPLPPRRTRPRHRRRVDTIGGWDDTGTTWEMTRREAVDAIRDGEFLYVEYPEGNRAELLVVGSGRRAHLRTAPRGGAGNNLGRLPSSNPTV